MLTPSRRSASSAPARRRAARERPGGGDDGGDDVVGRRAVDARSRGRAARSTSRARRRASASSRRSRRRRRRRRRRARPRGRAARRAPAASRRARRSGRWRGAPAAAPRERVGRQSIRRRLDAAQVRLREDAPVGGERRARRRAAKRRASRARARGRSTASPSPSSGTRRRERAEYIAASSPARSHSATGSATKTTPGCDAKRWRSAARTVDFPAPMLPSSERTKGVVAIGVRRHGSEATASTPRTRSSPRPTPRPRPRVDLAATASTRPRSASWRSSSSSRFFRPPSARALGPRRWRGLRSRRWGVGAAHGRDCARDGCRRPAVDELPGSARLHGKAMREAADVPSKAQVKAAVPKHCFTPRYQEVAWVRRNLGRAVAGVPGGGHADPAEGGVPPALGGVRGGGGHGVDGDVGRRPRVRPRRLLGQQAPRDRRRLPPAHGAPRAVLFVAALARRAPRAHEPHHQGRRTCPPSSAGAPGSRTPAARPSSPTRGGLQGRGRAPARPPPRDRLAGVFAVGRDGRLKYGTSNHFVPARPFSSALWDVRKGWASKVWQSDVGVVAMVAALAALATKVGAASVLALYAGLLAVVNMWLVGYTWLRTPTSTSRTSRPTSFRTCAAPSSPSTGRTGRIFDWFHHRIGLTHVAHHIDCTIPHYHAKEATDAIAAAFRRRTSTTRRRCTRRCGASPRTASPSSRAPTAATRGCPSEALPTHARVSAWAFEPV